MNTEDLTKLICKAEAEKGFLEGYWNMGICSSKYKEDMQRAIDEQIKHVEHFSRCGDTVRCDTAISYLKAILHDIQTDHELGLMK